MAAPMEKEKCSNDEDDSIKNEHLRPKVHRYNWLLEHPKYVEMKSWRLGNDEQMFITLIVYLNLCEAKDWWSVDIHPCRELCLAFITGKPTKKGDVRVVLPITTETQLSQKRLRQFLKYIRLPPATMNSSDDTDTKLQEDDKPNSLVLAITESGSTIVYYQISNGLVTPSDAPKDVDEEDESSYKRWMKHSRKRRKKEGPSGVQETVTEYANEERDDDCRDEFMEEEL